MTTQVAFVCMDVKFDPWKSERQLAAPLYKEVDEKILTLKRKQI